MDGINELLQRSVGGNGELAHDAGTLALAAFLAQYRGYGHHSATALIAMIYLC